MAATWPYEADFEAITGGTTTAKKTFADAMQTGIRAANVAMGFSVFGDGSDGAATLDGATDYASFSSRSGSTYTATRDIFCANLTVNAGVELKMAGFRLYVSRTLTLSGTGKITCNGVIGLLGAGGASAGASGVLAATGTGGNGGNPGGGSAGTSVTVALGTAGGAGGTGGGGAGGAGGTRTAPTAVMGSIRVPPSYLTGLLFGASGMSVVQGGAGGGGGGGDGAAAVGGGGGGGGGVLIICARSINLSGTGALEVKGGDGQDRSAVAGCAGGGGGGCGSIIFVYRTNDAAVAPSAITNFSGGAAGPGNGGGGANGTAGTNGSNANNLFAVQLA